MTTTTKYATHLYVSTGEQTKMYTLRAAYNIRDSHGLVIENTTGHIKNLSTNYDVAVEKALEYAKSTGIDFRWSLTDFSLNPIERGLATEKPVKLTREEKKAIKALELKAEAQRQYDVMMVSGLMQIGKHSGLTVREVYERDKNYILYAASKSDDEFLEEHSRFAVNVALCKEFLLENPSLFPPVTVKGNNAVVVSAPLLGEIGDKVEEVEFTVIRASWVSGYYYDTQRYRIFGVTANNEYVMVYTNMKALVSATEGDVIKVGGGEVKKHIVYDEINTSIIGGRLKVL